MYFYTVLRNISKICKHDCQSKQTTATIGFVDTELEDDQIVMESMHVYGCYVHRIWPNFSTITSTRLG